MNYNGLPIYEARIANNKDGITAISLVDYPAVEKNFVCFEKDRKKEMFAVENEEERLITGVVMLADTPIYRVGPSGYEYWMVFNKETIKEMASKMLKDGTFKLNDLQHNGEFIEGMELVELYIKNEKKGINPSFIKDIPDGSLMATYHITDDALWDEVKNGNYLNGFSLEGYFDIERTNNNYKSERNIVMKLIEKFLKKLVKLSEIASDKGVLLIADGDEIAVGTEIFVNDENGDWVNAEDGVYALEDGRKITVAEGKIAEIEDPNAVEEPAVDEPAEEVEAEEEAEPEVESPDGGEEAQPDAIEEIRKEINELYAVVDALTKRIAELEGKPAADPIEEDFEKVKNVPETKNKAAKLLSSLKK